MQGRPGSSYLVQPLDVWPSAARKQSVCSPTKPDSDFFSSTVAGYCSFSLSGKVGGCAIASSSGTKWCLAAFSPRYA
ncbi:hypothetical protein V8C44DRAFT_338669 [Trichoderma aethiopicum]